MTFDRQSRWLNSALVMEGSVLPYIWPRLVFFGGFSLLISALYTWQQQAPAEVAGAIAWLHFEQLRPLTNNVACNLVLGLLLVFRTNTAYERFWEGRKAWGMLVVTVRNLSRELAVALGSVALGSGALGSGALGSEADAATKEIQTRFNQRLVSFVIATKCRLRGQGMMEDLAEALPEADGAAMAECDHRPLQLALWMGQDLRLLEQQSKLSEGQRIELNQRVNSLVDGLSACERILSTPMPASYGIYLKRLMLIYCLLLPFSMVSQLGWWTPLAVLLVSFVLLGVDAIANEIEDPFGYDFNDLPLDQICKMLQGNIDQMVKEPVIYPRCVSLKQGDPSTQMSTQQN